MILNRTFWLAIFIVTILSSCSEQARFNKVAGVYDVYKYERIYYNTAGEVDSTYTVEDLGSIGLVHNNSDTYNNVYTVLPGDFFGWNYWGVGGTKAVGWYIDEVDGKTLSFFSSDDYYDYFVNYLVEEKAGKKAEWSTIIPNNQGGIAIKEIIYVKKQ